MQLMKTELLAKKEDPACTGFDWKVKWIIGSSAMSSIREPVAQVDLQTLKINQKEHVKDTVKVEMNKGELDNFISQLQKAVNETKGSQQ